ncbi:MAG: two-component regulator propeller domain-containing protein, partial [Dehalococcoidia bacterium]
MKKIFLITLVILSFLPILAPSTQAQGSYSLWRRFTTKDGLADSDVQAIFADRKGNLWFGTANGLSRYDGSTWWKFTTEGLNRYDDGSWRTFQTEEALVDDNVQAIAQDADGNLWVGTFGGVSAFDRDRLIASYTFESTSRQGDQVTSVTTGAVAGGDEVPVKFADQTEADVALSSGYVMFGADLTFYRYKGYHTPAGSLVIEPALKEDISAGTLVYAVEVGLANNDVKAIAIDGKGGVWFGTEGGVSCLAPDGTWVTYTTWNSPLVENDVRAISKDGKGNLWFGTDGGGVSRLASDGSWETYTAEDGLGGDYVLAILRDRDDSLWFATTTFSEAHEYIGKGVSRRTADGTWRTYTTQDGGLADDWVQALWQDQEGHLWFGTREGVSRLAPDDSWVTYSTQNSLLPHNRIQAIAEDAEGNLWFGTRRGAVRFNDRAWRTMPVGPDGLASSYIQALLRDRQGNLWFGTEGGGVSCLAP